MAGSIDPGQVHSERPLDNISIAFSNTELIGGSIAPVVPVTNQADEYWIFNQPEWFRDEAGFRAPGTRAKTGSYSMSKGTYRAREVAFDGKVVDESRKNADAGMDPDRRAIEFATGKVLLSMELRVASLLQTSGNWATTVAAPYKWDDYDNSDPSDDVKGIRQTIRSLIGRNPNTLVISERVLEALEDHPLVNERLPTNVAQFADISLLARIFKVQTIQVGKAIYTTSPEGTASPTYTDIWTDTAWLGWVNPRPALEEPSALYVFDWGGRRVVPFREQGEESDYYRVKTYQDEKIVSTICGATITDVLA